MQKKNASLSQPKPGDQSISGLILAGGLGRRMGGRDKGLVEWRGRPLIEHVLERFAPQVDSLIINANRNIEQYEAYGHTVVQDRFEGYQGPLAGIHAGLSECKTDWLCVVPVDAPLINEQLVKDLSTALQANPDLNCIVLKSDGRIHPTFMLVHKGCLGSLEEHLQGKKLKLTEWVREEKYGTLDYSELRENLMNVNKLEDEG